MSHLTVKEEIVVDESQKPASKLDEVGTNNPAKAEEPGTSNPVKAEEPGTSNPAKAEEPLKKKARARGSAKKVKDKTCVETCKPGKRSGCTIRGRGKPAGNLSCAEVDRRLEALGVNATNASLCVKAAIQKGLIEITGEDKEELKQVVYSDTGRCGHNIDATLEDLLKQPDYGGNDYENGLEEATVLCKEPDCAETEEAEGKEEGRTYVTRVCEGRPSFNDGKFHSHCPECPGFGICIGDYREAHCDECGKHYFSGLQGFPCPCQPRGRGRGFGDSDDDDNEESDCVLC